MNVLIFAAVVILVIISSKISGNRTTSISKGHNEKEEDWLDELIIYDCVFDDDQF